MSDDELVTLHGFKMKELMWDDTARQRFHDLTPEELMALADIMKKAQRGAYDDPGD